MKTKTAARLLRLSLALLAAAPALGSPRVEPDSLTARHDLLLIEDRKAIRTPLTSFPYPLGRNRLDDAGAGAPGRRLAERYRSESALGWQAPELSLSVSPDKQPFAAFGLDPDGEAASGLSVAWLGEWAAARLSVAVVEDDIDSQDVWIDGSYLSLALGNWMLSLEQTDRWWGPGWDGSLILSNNARPAPNVSLSRIGSEPFRTPWLSWIGPWHMETFMGQLSNDEGDRAGSDALLWGMRVEFSPFGLDFLDIGLARTAQWAGDGRKLSFGAFWDLFQGNDNVGPGIPLDPEDEPGNQLGGGDWRLRIPGVNLAQYGQIIGEDETSFLPDANMVLYGLESWGEIKALKATWRAYAEFADTRAGHLGLEDRQNRGFNVAFNHSIFREGYRHRGRVIGHAIDGDGIMRSLGGFLVQDNGVLWGAKLRDYSINRDGRGPNSVSVDPLEGFSAEIFAEGPLDGLAPGNRLLEGLSLQARLHYIDEDNVAKGTSSTDVGGFLTIVKQL